jgi:hypothetical protein
MSRRGIGGHNFMGKVSVSEDKEFGYGNGDSCTF